jgi:hypothetical protein
VDGLVPSYGPGGVCWRSISAHAQQCKQACINALASYNANGGCYPAPDAGTQAPVCAKYLECLDAQSAGSAESLQSSYGPSGTCWSTSTAAAQACTEACTTALGNIAQTANPPAACL